MADPKYSGLPGIAVDQPDSYETDDLPEHDQHAKEQEKFDSEHIEAVNIDSSSAYQTFRGANIDGSTIDFSDQLSRKHRRGYGTGPNLFEMVGHDNSEPETAEQRYNRLCHEISELCEHCDRLKTESKQQSEALKLAGSITPENLAMLQSQLKQLQLEQILGGPESLKLNSGMAQLLDEVVGKVQKSKGTEKKKSEDACGVVYELFYSPSQGQSEVTTKIASVDERLRKLEKLLDPSSGKMESVKAMSSKLQLLDMTNLEMIEARLTTVLQKLNSIKEKQESLGTDDSEKVNELYELVKKWDAFSECLPQVVSRMQTLQDLHEQAMQFSQALTQLDGIQQQLTKTLENDSALLEEVQSALQANMQIIAKNCENLEKRMKALGC